MMSIPAGHKRPSIFVTEVLNFITTVCLKMSEAVITTGFEKINGSLDYVSQRRSTENSLRDQLERVITDVTDITSAAVAAAAAAAAARVQICASVAASPV